MIVAYIAHPIGGDVKSNVEKVLAICRHINLTETDVIPFAPYIVDCLAMDDNIPEQRSRGISNSLSFVHPNVIDELRLYGDTISTGMQGEIDRANSAGIPVISMTEGTEHVYSDKHGMVPFLEEYVNKHHTI